MNTENSKTNQPHKSVPNSSQRLELRSSNKYDALQNSFIYFAWKKIRQKYKIYSSLYRVHHEKRLPSKPPIHIYINRVNDRLVFTIKDEHKLDYKHLK